MIRERKRTGREKLETIKSYKFSFKGSGEMKLQAGERRKGYGVTSVSFGWAMLQLICYDRNDRILREGDDVRGKRRYSCWSHVMSLSI